LLLLLPRALSIERVSEPFGGADGEPAPTPACRVSEVWTCVDRLSIHHDIHPLARPPAAALPSPRGWWRAPRRGRKSCLCRSARPQVKTCAWWHHRQKESSDSSRCL